MRRILVSVGQVTAEAEFEENDIASSIIDTFPFKTQAALWGDEIYFGIPVFMQTEDVVDHVKVGDIAYWQPGHAFCIFFGRTPTSQGNEIRPASPVTIIGRIVGDARVFAVCNNGDPVKIELLQPLEG